MECPESLFEVPKLLLESPKLFWSSPSLPAIGARERDIQRRYSVLPALPWRSLDGAGSADATERRSNATSVTLLRAPAIAIAFQR
jgi:hypothetical protein